MSQRDIEAPLGISCANLTSSGSRLNQARWIRRSPTLMPLITALKSFVTPPQIANDTAVGGAHGRKKLGGVKALNLASASQIPQTQCQVTGRPLRSRLHVYRRKPACSSGKPPGFCRVADAYNTFKRSWSSDVGCSCNFLGLHGREWLKAKLDRVAE